MRKIDRRNELSELNDDATDGQFADYLAADLSGDFGNWNVGLVVYECNNCGRILEFQSDVLDNFSQLICAWHDKATEGDCFSRFVFEYLAFIANLKNNLYYKEKNDRQAIQCLKRDRRLANLYLEREKEYPEICATWKEVISALANDPLRNSSLDMDNPEIDKWWDCSDKAPNTKGSSSGGKVRSLDDWDNMVEFWYGVRNNLFHGGKEPNIKRDIFLVESAFITLRLLVGIMIENLVSY